MKAIGRWLHPSAWHWLVIFLMLGIFGGLFAWFSYNLLQLFTANFRFVSTFGVEALRLGGLRQALELIVSGYLAIACYVAFKACEIELVARLRARAAPPGPPPLAD